MANNLNYKRLGETTLVQRRIQRKFEAKLSSYKGGGTAQIELSSGSSSVYGPNCYIVADITSSAVTGTAAAPSSFRAGSSTTSGSAMNCFASSLIKINGKEMDRIDGLNTLTRNVLAWNTDTELLHAGLGSVSGYTTSTGVQDFDANNAAGQVSKRVIIPLRWVSGIYANTEQLIPSGMINGTVLSLKLEDAATAFVSAVPINYVVENLSVVLDLYELNDSANIYLKREASKDVGLVFSYATWKHQRTNASNVSSVAANVGKPMSHVLAAVTVCREATAITDSTVDSFQSYNYGTDFPSWRYLLGGISFPEENVDSLEESYMIAQQTFNKMKDYSAPNSISVGEYKNGTGIIASSFERMGYLLEQSGMRLNVGGRSLFLNWKIKTPVAGLTLDTYMKHMVAVSIFSDGNLVPSF